MIHSPLALGCEALISCAFFSIQIVLIVILVCATLFKDRRRRQRWSVSAMIALTIWVLVFILLPSLIKARSEPCKKLGVNNLRLIEHAIDEVLVASNFSSTAAITVEMVNQRLKAGSISNMNWPTGTILPDEKAIQASESNALSVVLNGETVTSGRQRRQRSR